MDSVTDVRGALIDFVRADLVGPAHGRDEVIEDPPYVKYAAGVLFPQESKVDESGSVRGVEADDAEDSDADFDDDVVETEGASLPDQTETRKDGEAYDEAVRLANQYKPSAIALTFAIPEAVRHIDVAITAAEYDGETRSSADGRRQNRVWKRRELSLDPIRLPLPGASIEHHSVADGLKFCLRVSDKPVRHIVTASLYNDTEAGGGDTRTFYQVGFSVSCAESGCELVEYSDSEHAMAFDDEELSLEMMYRARKSFAVGHGCAADWVEGDRGGATSVRTESIPRVVVPPVEPRSGESSYLSMEFLQGTSPDPVSDIPRALGELCGNYEAWIDSKSEQAVELPAKYEGVAASNLTLCRLAVDRIRRGVDTIAADEIAMEAFKLANRAILMQQHHSRLPVRKIDGDPVNFPGWTDYESDWVRQRGYWRTFQLAFVLMVIPGLVDETDWIRLDDEDIATRDLVDLIWFPTGGGKTEAYLGLSAFLIFLTRLRNPSRTGCNVLMRYTLRLLTSQQFQRAASLICACELIRAKDPDRFGVEPISIGLWVGKSLTPNDEKAAQSAVRSLMKQGEEGKNPFQLLSCPWCGTVLNDKKKLGYLIYQNRHRFVCPNSGTQGSPCPFSSPMNLLPVCVVDDSIYDNPPTLLIGTVDKFAILAWRQRAGQIFRVGGGADLIIQDELHLISGPLGSMVGLYESVIDFLCTDSKRPKIIASTATIRRAREQCRSLYARPMFQFPPPALDASDSYFATENPKSAGRLYAGFLPTAVSSALTAQIRSVVALQQGLFLLHGELTEEWIDPYFTLIQYFGSLKELGRAATFVKADIPEFLPTMHRRYGLSKDDDPDRRRYMHTSEELTSRRNEDEIPKILARLEQRYSHAGRYESQALDTVLATNMISVGIDVERLGLMMIVTQPKGTSEYIQASSRVGRSANSPGLVFTLYNAGRPRDRSHYEQFRPYHDAFYRYVEPTSVTPFSPPALERALHAVLVIAGRHVAGWTSPQAFDRSNIHFGEFLSFLRDRVDTVDPEHALEFENLLGRRLDEWTNIQAEAWGDIAHPSDKLVLMRPAGRPKDDASSNAWEIPTSMRNVDVACGATVVRYPG